MQGSVEFWYEFASTYSYPAAMRATSLAQAHDLEIVWQPFLLGPIFKDLGWSTSPFNLQPAKGAYMWRDLARTCAALNLPFVRPEPFPQNGLRAARIAVALTQSADRSAFSRAVYTRAFGQGQDISDPALLADVLGEVGLDAAPVLERAATPAVKDALRRNTDAARAHGLFGAPTWRTSDGEIFWGNDRLADALAWEKRLSA